MAHTNIKAALTTEIKDREAILKRITVNTAVASAVVTVYDNTTEGTLAADPDGISTVQTPASGPDEALTITGALASGGVATLGYGRKVTITSGSDDEASEFIITGTNANGVVQTETITLTSGPGIDTGTKEFLTVTSVVVDLNTVGTITVGAAIQSGTIIATITMPGTLLQNHFTLEYDVPCFFGLTVVTSSTADITVVSE